MDFKAISKVARSTISKLKQDLGSGMPESITEINGLRNQVLRLGKELGRKASLTLSLINYDLRWNPVRFMQRIGRTDRRLKPNYPQGSGHGRVHTPAITSGGGRPKLKEL